MPNINTYIQELNRRKVFKSAGLYAFSAFIIMQVATLIVPALHLPEWTNTLILVLLVLGFPIADFRRQFRKLVITEKQAPKAGQVADFRRQLR